MPPKIQGLEAPVLAGLLPGLCSVVCLASQAKAIASIKTGENPSSLVVNTEWLGSKFLMRLVSALL